MALVKTEIMVAAPPGDRTSYINVYHSFQFVLQSFSTIFYMCAKWRRPVWSVTLNMIYHTIWHHWVGISSNVAAKGVNNQLFPSNFIYNTWVIWKFPYEGWAKASPVQ